MLTQKTYTHYNDLKGATGSSAKFRPERIASNKLFKYSSPTICIGDTSYPIINLSVNGIAFADASDIHPFKIGDTVTTQIKLGKTVLFESAATVVRIETKRLVAVQLIEKSLEFEELTKRYYKAELMAEKVSFRPNAYAEIPESYKAFCADLRINLDTYQQQLAEFEAGIIDQPALQRQALKKAEASVLECWEDILIEGNKHIEGLKGEQREAVKAYTEAMVTPSFMHDPFWQRVYQKPLGYPGDYMIMKGIYDNAREGKDIAAKLLYALAMVVGACVRNRSAMAGDIIKKLTEQDNKPLKIANIGCGTANEISAFLGSSSHITKPIHFTMIDQDKGALELSYSRAHHESALHYPHITLSSLQTSFMGLIKGDDVWESLPKQDFIYSLGLLDYMRPAIAKSFIKAMYDALNPGGTMVIANMANTPNRVEWILSYVFDWDLFYRTEEEMIAFTKGLDAASIRVQAEPANHVYVLTLQKSF